MENNQLPVDSDCYAEWVLDDQNLFITHASITIFMAGAPVFTQDTDGSQLEILENPKCLRLRIDQGQILKKGIATVKIVATDERGSTAKRRIDPEMIRFW